MTPVPSSQPSRKSPGKQIRGGLGLWGSKLTRAADATCSEFRRSPEPVEFVGFGAILIPEAAAGPLQHASCCFPHASPVSSSRPGKHGGSSRKRFVAGARPISAYVGLRISRGRPLQATVQKRRIARHAYACFARSRRRPGIASPNASLASSAKVLTSPSNSRAGLAHRHNEA